MLRKFNLGSVEIHCDRFIDIPAIHVHFHVEATHPIVCRDLFCIIKSISIQLSASPAVSEPMLLFRLLWVELGGVGIVPFGELAERRHLQPMERDEREP